MMEQFEIWDRKEYPLPSTTERGPIGRDALKQRKHVWRAALREVLDQIEICNSDGSIIVWIKQELGDT